MRIQPKCESEIPDKIHFPSSRILLPYYNLMIVKFKSTGIRNFLSFRLFARLFGLFPSRDSAWKKMLPKLKLNSFDSAKYFPNGWVTLKLWQYWRKWGQSLRVSVCVCIRAQTKIRKVPSKRYRKRLTVLFFFPSQLCPGYSGEPW